MSDSDKVNILIVDDLPEKLLVLRSILEELDENVIAARSGEQALARVLESEFAVILLDINMPGLDGYETAQLIRRRKKSAHTPIIFITAFADELHTAQGYSLGAVDYILSPVVPEILRTKVRVFVELARMTQQARRQADERVALAREQAARAAAEETTRRSAFLAEASKVLSSSLEPVATVRGLARAVVPFLADFAAVALVDAQGRLGPAELVWREAGGAQHEYIAETLSEASAPLSAAVERAVAAGRSEELACLTAAPAESNGELRNGDARFPNWDILGPALVLPLQARGRTLGVLTLARAASNPVLGHADRTLVEDLASRAAIALDNARLYQNIQEGDRRKDEFLAMLAHELRNPLAPIRNAVEVLRRLGSPDPLLAQTRDMIDRQVTHMARLVDDLLDVSRLSRGKILLRREVLDLRDLVAATVEDYRSTLAATGLTLQARLPSQPLVLKGDPTRLAQALGNILHNAAKFTNAGGEVTVEVAHTPSENAALLVVRDTGIGMEPEMLSRVFEAFSQAESSLDRSRGGLGLGLTLVKGLVELHGGCVRAFSEGLGRGTEITLQLPLLAQEMPAARPVAPRADATPSHRILIIEDNADAAKSMQVLLTMTGHQVAVASTGNEGLNQAKTFRPGVVLCDLGLPGGMDGFAVARAFRGNPSLASAYLIAATGYGQTDDLARSKEAGFDHHLVKPVDFEELQSLLNSLRA